jgi:SAM-dependent methyltransferase
MRAFLALKTIMVILELIGLYMLSRIVKRRSVMLLALSPTLVVAGALSGHTDILLVALFGAALWTWRRDRAGSTVVLLTLAGWVKLWPLLFVVVFCVHVARRQPLMALKYAAGSVATTLLLWIPFMHMDVPGNILGSLELYVRWFEFNAGPYFVVKEWYWWTTGMDWSKKIGPAFRMAFLIGTAAIWLMQSIAPRRLAFVVSDPKNQPWLLCWVIACAYFLLSTTIHPWYVVGLVVMGIVLFEDRIPWHIVVFSVLSFGTYVLYVDGPYWWSVGLSWSIPGVVWIWLQVSGRRTGWMDRLLRWRAWSKMQMMRPWIVPGRGRVLDLGGAEGYVAEAILDRYPAWSAATIAETRAAVRTNHEYVVYDGFVLPMPDDSYGLVIASYVLHHADDADRVLSEALRVSTGRVVVLESVYGSALERVWLEWADRFANALRSRGEMGGRNDRLDHRRQDAWIRAAREQGGSVVAQRTVVRPGHTTAVLVLERLHGEPGDPGNL